MGGQSLVTLCCLILAVSICDSKLASVEKLSHGKNVVCYVGTWAYYRPGKGKFDVDDIKPKLCSHLIYSFVGLDNSTYAIRSIDNNYDLDENYGKGSFKRYTQLKKKASHLKVLLAVGGWNEGSEPYSIMASDPVKRRSFVTSAVEFATKYDFDGIDLDWEFPTERGGKPEDKENFVILLKELRKELHKRNLILTAAINASPRIIDKAYDVVGVSKNVDLIHLMSYDYHGGWDKRVGANAPLYSSDGLDLETSIKHILKQGAAPEKVIVGIAAYGHTFLTDDSSEPQMHVSAQDGNFKGKYTRQDGFMGYNEICDELTRESGWEERWDNTSHTPYTFQANKVIAYDNLKSIEEKVKFALKYNVGGFLVWSIDTDDFRGDCDQYGSPNDLDSSRKFPILRTIHKTIVDADKEDIDVTNISHVTMPEMGILFIATFLSLICAS